MKTLNFNPVALFQILQEDESPARLEAKVVQLIDYYEQGYENYRKTVSVDDRFDYADTGAFLQRLHKLTQEFQQTDTAVSLILTRESQQINVMPLTSFFTDYSPEECLELLSVVESACIEYIHAGNCVEMKSAFQTITRWRYVFRDIQGD